MAEQLERNLSAELRELAASARPPADAWERFARRVAEAGAPGDTPGPTAVVVMEPGPERRDGHRPPEETEFAMGADHSPRHRRWMLLGSAAALVALAVAGVVVATRDDDGGGAASEQADPVGTQTDSERDDESAVDAYLVVTGAYEAFNDGALAAWGAERAPATDLYTLFALTSEERARTLDSRYEDVSCTHVGFGAHEFRTDAGTIGPFEGDRFECSGVLINAFSRAAGVEFPREFVWVVRDGQVVSLDSGGSARAFADIQRFEQGFLQWLSREHPDVLEERGIDPDPFEMEAADEDLPVLLQYLDEFVEQSDQWPLGGD